MSRFDARLVVVAQLGGAMDLPEPDDRLNSWKEIAAFLGRTVRTVQRWEKHDGLPLRRGGPSRRGVVFASKREISDWWKRRRSTLDDIVVTDEPPGTPSGSAARWRTALPVSLIVLLVAVGAVLVPVLRRVAATIESPPTVGRLFAASTSEGRTDSFIPLNAVPSALALASSGRIAFVALYDEHVVALVDLHARQVVDRFGVVEHPLKLAVTQDGGRLVIQGESDVGVFHLGQRTLTRFSAGGGTIRDMHVSHDGRYVWLTFAQAGLKILDIESGRWETLPTVGCPMYLTPAPHSRRLFVSYQCGGPHGRSGHDAIEIIDEHTRTPILAGAGPPLVGSRVAVSPDERHLWTDTGDACAVADYDRAGCPPGSGPVLHALRADTLDALLTIRIPGDRFGAVPIFFPDGTRLVLVGPEFAVIDRALGTMLESIDRESGFGEFTGDGSSFIALDPTNRGLRVFNIAVPLDAGPLRDARTHWSGDGTANDIIGGGHGATTEVVRFEPGRYGRAFSFDSSSKGVSFGRRLDADIADDPAAYAAWIKPRRTDVRQHIASRTSLAGWSWSVTKEGRLAFCLVDAQPDLSCDDGGLVGRTSLHPDRWYHVAIVRTSSAFTLFVDGHDDASRPLAAGDAAPEVAPVLRLGAGPEGAAPFHGLIDEVLLFARALTAEDIEHVMRVTTLDAKLLSPSR